MLFDDNNYDVFQKSLQIPTGTNWLWLLQNTITNISFHFIPVISEYTIL